mmetsp:Transcript_38559/g.120442  ORF Transcript_38559/g.120442 Transcript_38559/m.120442 type:complete len:324 (-) Transcript_38559:146-1117(-)
MPFHLLTLAHQHGPAAVFSVFLVYKYAKYRFVCWRSGCVNEEVRTLTEQRLNTQGQHLDQNDELVEELVVKKPMGQGPSVCAACSCPLWLRRDADECVVQLKGCGCVLHSTCLMKAALEQHGMTLPSISDLAHVVVLLRRFFGVDSVAVESVRCPGCEASSTLWCRIPEDGGRVISVASRKKIAKALRRGDALRLDGLRAALQAAPAPVAGFDRWLSAAKSDSSLCALLKEEGPDASRQLADILLSATPEGAATAPESSSAESEGRTRSAESESEPGGAGKPRATCKLCAALPESSAALPPEGAALEDVQARLRAYTEFLAVG